MPILLPFRFVFTVSLPIYQSVQENLLAYKRFPILPITHPLLHSNRYNHQNHHLKVILRLDCFVRWYLNYPSLAFF